MNYLRKIKRHNQIVEKINNAKSIKKLSNKLVPTLKNDSEKVKKIGSI